LKLGIELFAHRDPLARQGATLTLVSRLGTPRWVTIAIRDRGLRWSPSVRSVLVPALSTCRVTLPQAIGDTAFLFAGDNVDALDREAIAFAPLVAGDVLQADGSGQFLWEPTKRWLVVVPKGAPWTLAPQDVDLPALREALRRPDDPLLDEALGAIFERDDVRLRVVGPGSPLEGAVSSDSAWNGLLEAFYTVLLEPGEATPVGLRLRVVQPGGPRRS
jgi:hypothetical protein